MRKDSSYLTELRRLADAVRTATNFSEAFDVFERGLMQDDRFIRSSDPAADPLIERTLEYLARRFVGQGAGWSWLVPLLRYAPGRFLHGAALVGGRPTVLFYFEEHDLGLACIATGRQCVYTRLTKLALPRGTTVSRDRGNG